MIPKMTSHDFNNILNNAAEKIENINMNIDTIKTSMQSKLKIIRYECEYLEQEFLTIDEEVKLAKNNLSLFNKSFDNYCQFYGLTATPKFKDNCFNILNLITKEDGNAYYRDIINVSINGIEKDEYKNIFKHETIDNKEIYFDEFDVDKVTVSAVIDPTKTLANSMFNVIELDSFFNGSFDIESIKIYTDIEGSKYDEIANFKNAGKMRIMLDKSYSFYRVDFTFKLNYYTSIDFNKIYPFGLKHIYFYNASFLSNSYGIIEINTNEYINYINENIKIRTPNEIIESTLTNMNIEIYLNCMINNDGTYELSSKQAITNNQLSINTKRLYAKVPLQKYSIIGIQFDVS